MDILTWKQPKRASNAVKSLFLLLSALVFSSLNASAAESTAHQTKLDVKLGAIPIGVATFNITLDGKSYFVQGKGKTAGIAQLFSPGRGNFTSVGTLNGETIRTVSHQALVKERKEKATLLMTFKDDKVEQVELNPDKRWKRQRSSRWIPILPEHKTGVIDPASSLLVPLKKSSKDNPKTVCNHTFSIFDGESRYDMRMTFKKTKNVKTEGYVGPAYVCKLKYVPIAGHKKGRKSIERMRKNEKMEIWLAPIQGTELFTFIRIEVGTEVGKFLATPRFFGKIAEK